MLDRRGITDQVSRPWSNFAIAPVPDMFPMTRFRNRSWRCHGHEAHLRYLSTEC
jgi:hypothetical protein